MADSGCRSHGMFGNQLNKTLTNKTPLYMSSHFASPAATTVRGVFRYPLGRSRILAKNAGPTVRTILQCREDLFRVGAKFWMRDFMKRPDREKIVETVRVESARRGVGVTILEGLKGKVGNVKEEEEEEKDEDEDEEEEAFMGWGRRWQWLW